MTSTINNGTAQRKQLSTQLDRLDQILDGLDAALNESVATAVTEVVGQVVKQAVETTIREVLGNPDLLRAALAQHNPPPPPKPNRRTLKDLLTSVRDWVAEKAEQMAGGVKKSLSTAWKWSLEKVRKGCKAVIGVCVGVPAAVVAIGRGLWQFRKTCLVAVSVGLLAGVGSYFAGPVIASIVSGISGAALTVSGMILVPLWRLMMGDDSV